MFLVCVKGKHRMRADLSDVTYNRSHGVHTGRRECRREQKIRYVILEAEI